MSHWRGKWAVCSVVGALLALPSAVTAASYPCVLMAEGVAVIDTATETVVDRIAVERVGRGMAVHPSGSHPTSTEAEQTANATPTGTPTEFFPGCCLNVCAGSPLCGPTHIPTETPTTPTPPTPTVDCFGDCDRSGSVTIDELVMMVRTVLAGGELACRAQEGSGPLTIADIVRAVAQALAGCGSG